MFKFRKNPLEGTFEDIEKTHTGLMQCITDGTKAKIAVACASALVLGLGVAATAAMVNTGAGTETNTAATVDTTPQGMTIDVTADDGWTSTSTPAIVHITGRTTTGGADSDETVDFYHAVNPSADNAGTDDIELAPGVYTAETISPLNADGSAYTVWKTGEAKHFAVSAIEDEDETEATAAAIVNPFVTVAYAAEGDVHYHSYADCNDCHGHFDLYNTGVDYEHLFSEFDNHAMDTGHNRYTVHTYACTKTDCTYTKLEKQGKCLVVQMQKVPADQVTDEMVKDIVDKTTQAVAGGDSSLKGDAGKDVLEKLDANVKNNPNASDEAKASAETAKETTDTSGEGGKTGGSSKGDSGSGSKGDAHTHNWVASTHTVHHDAVTHVVHHDAVTHTEDVTEEKQYDVCVDCGFLVPYEETITHPYGGLNAEEQHAVDNRHFRWVDETRTVVVGTKTVVDTPAWDETVTDSAAWDETVTDGYTCSTCGATK